MAALNTLQDLLDYAARDRYSITDDEWEESEHPRGQPGNAGQFAKTGNKENKTKGVAARLRDEFTEKTKQYVGSDFKNKSSGITVKFTKKSQDEIKSNVYNSKQNGYTIQEHFEAANQIKDLFEDADFIKEHDDTKNHQPNVKIERFLSQPVELSTGRTIRACITVKHSLDKNGHHLYSLEAMDIKNALEKTRAKGQPQDRGLPNKDNLTQDAAEVKSLYALLQSF